MNQMSERAGVGFGIINCFTHFFTIRFEILQCYHRFAFLYFSL